MGQHESLFKQHFKPIQSQLDFLSTLTEQELLTIHWYVGEEIDAPTADEYKVFNKMMNDDSIIHHPYYLEKLAILDGIFARVPSLEQPLTVYRGIRREEHLTTKSFISTSLYKDVTIDFAKYYRKKTGCCVLEITVSAGSKILPIAELDVIKSIIAGKYVPPRVKEYEVLLDRNGRLDITRRYIEDKHVDYGRMIHYQMVYTPEHSINIEDLGELEEKED